MQTNLNESTHFQKWKERFKLRWCTINQLKKLVELKQLTQIEYEIISSEKYPSVQ